MHRLFLAYALPQPMMDLLDQTMSGVAGARWQSEEQLHLTMRYVGKADRRQCEDIETAVSQISFPPVDVALCGVGEFDPKRGGGALWAGISPHDELALLHKKLDRAVTRFDFEPDPRAFLPHITVARLPRIHGETASWRAAHGGLSSPFFRLDTLILYDSHTGHNGSHYEPLVMWRAQ